MMDKIEGSSKERNIISYALVNAYSINNKLFEDVKFSVSNYWVQDTDSDKVSSGKYLPLILKITGKLKPKESENV